MKIEQSIHINKAPNIVWKITEDKEKWPEWTPTMESVTRVDNGTLGLGSVA